ncbi:MAG TPA: DNA gyrase subunit A [Candidatus Dojkabacteria bacterium]|nr:DNA gyrase subunit A [Candidatus Dojkabacteria bacterium]
MENQNPKNNQSATLAINITDEIKKSYIDYSMSVIVSRALPDIRDGLKPSQRRILVAMNDLKLSPTAHYRKCAKIIGDTTGNYHPHGDAAAYQTLVNMAQDFGTRYTLVDGQGNFGSIDGDPPAQQRYTEARMTKHAMAMLSELDKGTVQFVPNYDATRKEPTVLPTMFPNLICNGCDGIAVGMATKIPPHNLGEIIDGVLAMIDKGNKWQGISRYNELRLEREKKEKIPKLLEQEPESYLSSYCQEGEEIQLKEGESLYPVFNSDIKVDELMKYIPGPDFPTYGIIYDQKSIREVYETGNGRIVMRAKADIEETKDGKYHIVIKELPYQTNKAFLVEKIAQLVKLQKIKGISDLRDESSREGMRVVITLSKAANPQVVLNKLFKLTDMQKAFNANMIALVNNEPRTVTLKDTLEHFISHRMIVTIRKVEFELAQARYREHILEGLKIALDHLDEVIATIRASKNQEEAKENLIKKFNLSEVQAQAILDMPLRRLAALERQKIEEEYVDVQKFVKELNEVLSTEGNILREITKELEELKAKYGDKRRTKIVKGAIGSFDEEDLIANEPTIITVSNSGYIKRVSPTLYKTQKRGGKGTIAAKTKDDDFIKHLLTCNTHDSILFFTSRGRVFEIKAHQIPEFSKQAKGTPIVNFIQIDTDEKISTIMIKPDNNSQNNYLLFATKSGLVKKTLIAEYESIRNSGLIAIIINEGDELLNVTPTDNSNEILLITSQGKAIRFKEKDIKPTARNTKGVLGIRFSKQDDYVVSMDRVGPNDIKVLILSERGYGKMTKLEQYPTQKRAGKGIFTLKRTNKTGNVSAIKVVSTTNPMELIVVSHNGILIKTSTEKVPTLSRMTQGVKIMNIGENDKVCAFAIEE